MKKSILLFAAIVINIIAFGQTKSIIYFDSNKSELNSFAFKSLDSIANALKDQKNYKIQINGYCDNTGKEEKNQTLSEQRAKVVLDYLKNKKLTEEDISTKGYSAKNPAANNGTENGKAKNRRTEILIVNRNTTIQPAAKEEIIEKEEMEVRPKNTQFNSSVKLSDLEVGKTLVLQNLNFEGGTAVLLPEAKPTLELLLKTMQENPTLEIEIGGHVCCFDDMPLSILRAQSVYKYLIKKGIAESRMTYKGYSRDKPIFQDDRDEAKARVNRRVEITVLKK